MKKWQKYTIIGAAAAVVLGLVIGCVLWLKPGMPVITNPDETTEPVLAATVPEETTEPTVEETTEPTVATTVPETEPVTVPEETEPATEPMVTEPEETEPAETTPKETAPKETQPKETTPKETEPKPTDPPKPTEHKHSYKAKVVEPTCEEKGYTVHTCSCGDSYTDGEKAALGHDMVEEVKEPGINSEGYTKHYCSRCDYSYKDNYTEALPEPTTTDIQNAIIKYINQYRAEQGSTQLTYLPGMTNVAVYRSKQLVTNFAHDTADKREALAYYQYGELVDMTTMGYDESYNYYEAQTQEAISSGYGIWGTADEIGEEFARGFLESSGHWRYLGSSEYSYIGVGVTCTGTGFYVCVMVGRVNYG